MQLSVFIEQLKDNCPILNRQVFGSIEMAQAEPQALKMPCVFVVPMSEKASGNQLVGGFSQHITAQFGVVICVQNAKADKGQAAHSQLETVRSEIFSALCGFETADYSPVDFVAGQLGDLDTLHTRWHDVFSTSYYYRNV